MASGLFEFRSCQPVSQTTVFHVHVLATCLSGCLWEDRWVGWFVAMIHGLSVKLQVWNVFLYSVDRLQMGLRWCFVCVLMWPCQTWRSLMTCWSFTMSNVESAVWSLSRSTTTSTCAATGSLGRLTRRRDRWGCWSISFLCTTRVISLCSCGFPVVSVCFPYCTDVFALVSLLCWGHLPGFVHVVSLLCLFVFFTVLMCLPWFPCCIEVICLGVPVVYLWYSCAL